MPTQKKKREEKTTKKTKTENPPVEPAKLYFSPGQKSGQKPSQKSGRAGWRERRFFPPPVLQENL